MVDGGNSGLGQLVAIREWYCLPCLFSLYVSEEARSERE